jgi:hypothetical protein
MSGSRDNALWRLEGTVGCDRQRRRWPLGRPRESDRGDMGASRSGDDSEGSSLEDFSVGLELRPMPLIGYLGPILTVMATIPSNPGIY